MRGNGGIRTLLVGLAAAAALMGTLVASSAARGVTGPGVARSHAASRVAVGAATASVGLAYATYPSSGKDRVWVASANGSHARNLGPGFVLSMSPNARYIAAGPSGAAGLNIYRTGGGMIHVQSQNTDSEIQASWSSNSQYLAVSWNDISTTKTMSGVTIVAAATGKTVASDAFTGQISGVSFAPVAGVRVAFVQGPSQGSRADLNVLTYHASTHTFARGRSTASTAVTTLIKNKRIANPLWTRAGIVYDSITDRGVSQGPVFQLNLLRSNHTSVQITHMSVPPLDDGLVPIATSSSGTRLIADFTGEDNVNAYAVNLTTHAVHRVAIPGTIGELTGDGISANGKQLLVNYGAFEQPTTHKAVVASIPFGGGTPKVLKRDASSPAWPQS